jgi:sigma-E factor negative regulatory protein RseB
MTASGKLLPIVLAALLLPGLAAAEDTADAWLERMNTALHELNYEGRFVYQHGQTLEAMYLSHTVFDGQERERLVSLTGLAREVIRDNNSVTCVVSGNDTQIDRRPAARKVAPLSPIRPDLLAGLYRFELGGHERVAGRSGRSLSILPQDELRYGYWLLLDDEHALPLAAATLGPDGQRISQLLFTELRVGDDLADPGPIMEGDAPVTRRTLPRREPVPQLHARWRFEQLPPGFVQTDYRRKLMGGDEREVEHFIFSDGLATVSVYAEEEQDNVAGSAGLSRLGAVAALRHRHGNYQLTAVGEVPEATLKRFLAGMQPIPAAP